MIAKKDKKADLERKRFAFFQIGLIVSGSLCLAAFEYSTANTEEEIVKLKDEVIDLEPEPVPTFEEKKEIPQRAKVLNPDVDTFNVVKNIPKTARFAEQREEIVDVTEGTGEEEYGFGTVPEPLPILEFSEVEPTFPGGPVAMYSWINSQVVYPSMPADMGIQGTVHLSFVVNEDGSIIQIESLSELNKDLEKEAIRVMRKMPKWIPGENAGKKVRVRYTIPFKFSLYH
ncbi:TonB family protein [Crocinitomix catalasitica]|nr:TonB family protein [Crocinitomix catalasitica]